MARDKEVIAFPTYGFRKPGDGDVWVMPVRVWVKEIKKTFGPRVREIIIRDVVDERSKPAPNRVEGMTIIAAPTVVPGATQFTD